MNANWGFEMQTLDAGRIREQVRIAVAERGLLSISGQRGSGKTHGVWRALEAAGATVVEPIRLDRERLTLADVLAAIVRDLSDERPRHSNEARAGQARRLLRGAAGPVALLVDDAHGLHHNTLRGLKRLRELGARGRREGALAIVLTGQADATRHVPEIGLRTTHLALTGLVRREIEQAVRQALAGDVDEGALARFVADKRAGNWLDLQSVMRDCLLAAQARGETRVTAEAVSAVLSPAAPETDARPDAAGDEERIAAVRRRRGARGGAGAGRQAAVA